MKKTFRPFGKQKKFLKSNKRKILAACGKRAGKTECGSIKCIMFQEQKPNWQNNGVDPYIGIIIAPTYEMLRRLSWKKFGAYALPFIQSQTKSPMEIKWHDGSEIYGISADKPERLEGVKAGWIWIDEVFQCKEQIFLEALARLSDSKGTLICTGSLGVQFINPKSHWAHKHFKELTDEETEVFEWSTSDNPHFPQDELIRMKKILDPMTFRQMFEIDWDTTPLNAVYPDFSVENILPEIPYKPHLETYVSIDWGWSHPMACLIFQYDRVNDTVYLIDELIESKTTLEMLYKWIMEKKYFINGWDCDIAGNQEREQTGISNVNWFKAKGIKFKFRSTAVAYGLPIVRSYILNGAGQRKLFIASKNKKTIECIKKYRYPDKDGKILNENPLKLDDDAADSLRYFFVNFLDRNLKTEVKVYNYL